MKFETFTHVQYTITEIIKECFRYNIGKLDINYIIEKFNLYKTDEMNENDIINLLIIVSVEMMINDKIYDNLAVDLLFYKIKKSNNSLNIFTFTDRQNYIFNNVHNYIDPTYIAFINDYADKLNNIYNSMELPDYLTYFGFMTMDSSYCFKANNYNIENPIDTFLRCSIGINYLTNNSLENIFIEIEKNFKYICQGKFIHATPTLFNSGTLNRQLSSCYILGMDDSIVGIYKNLLDCAKISQKSGGIGFSISNIRGSGSKITSNNGISSGLIPMMKVFSDTAHYVNQGGKRSGAIATFLEPWHIDIIEFIEIRLQNGSDYLRARDLFIGLWIPDLFMKQLETKGEWYLMCPNECKGLVNAYGDEFEELYWGYVKKGMYKKKIDPFTILQYIYQTSSESGLPYILFKDTVNKRCNQSNIGTVKSSNLCCEITEVADENNHSVCNLASIAVNRFINNGQIDYNELYNVSKHLTYNLNKCIDINNYPTEESKLMNLSTRPIGIGIQGMANLLIELRIPYETEQALEIESKVMEAIYYGALTASNELAIIFGPYEKFEGSPFSKGILQFDMGYTEFYRSDANNLMFDWTNLKNNICKYGVRNSLLTALMPTASTSQILGNVECFEPITSNLFIRKTSSGVFKCVNYKLIEDLKQINIWNENMKKQIIDNHGSIQNISQIPNNIKELYKTVWEIKQKALMDHALARAPFVDQSQSLNLHFYNYDIQKLKSAMFYAWKKGLKTGSYYIRTQASHNATNQAIQVKKEDECVSCSA